MIFELNKFIHLQWLLHAREYFIRQAFSADWFYPQNNENEWQHKANVQQQLQQFISLTVFQWVPMHSCHSQSWERKDCANDSTRNCNAKFHNDLRRGPTKNTNKVITNINYYVILLKNLRWRNSSFLQINGGTFIEALIGLFQSDFKRIFINNQNDHCNQQVNESSDNASWAFANRFFTFKILNCQGNKKFPVEQNDRWITLQINLELEALTLRKRRQANTTSCSNWLLPSTECKNDKFPKLHK